jgi:hypothetical protein
MNKVIDTIRVQGKPINIYNATAPETLDESPSSGTASGR